MADSQTARRRQWNRPASPAALTSGVDRPTSADSVEKLVPEKLSTSDPPKLAATVAFRKRERTNLFEIELSRASLSEISTSLSKAGVFQQNRPKPAVCTDRNWP